MAKVQRRRLALLIPRLIGGDLVKRVDPLLPKARPGHESEERRNERGSISRESLRSCIETPISPMSVPQAQALVTTQTQRLVKRQVLRQLHTSPLQPVLSLKARLIARSHPFADLNPLGLLNQKKLQIVEASAISTIFRFSFSSSLSRSPTLFSAH